MVILAKPLALHYVFVMVSVLFASPALTQVPASPSVDPRGPRKGGTVELALDLASSGRCQDALPLLKRLGPEIKDKQQKYQTLMATVRCAMNQRETQTAANALFDMKRDFPRDPEVLYMTSQFFLAIAESASQELASVAPDSYQTRELQAETLESQEKWAEAAAIYRQILVEHPGLRGIHYRLGRDALSLADSSGGTDEAKKEFEEELGIDPRNAAAEFWLGEIARRDSKWDDAISHFRVAAKLDSNFADALLSLGSALNSAGRYSEALSPLQEYAKKFPEDVTVHYQLALAYTRLGRDDDAAHERAVHQQLLEKRRATLNSRTEAAPH